MEDPPQVREDPPLVQDPPLAQAQEDQSQALVQIQDQINGGHQQQGNSFCLQWCWVQVMLQEKKQQVMMVGKRRLGGAMVMEDEMALQLKVE